MKTNVFVSTFSRWKKKALSIDSTRQQMTCTSVDHDLEPGNAVESVEADCEVQTETMDLASINSKLFHVIVCAGCSLIILLSFLLATPNYQQVTLGSVSIPELCTFKRFSAIGCPGCGMTRGFICISQGNWELAWYLNPASFLMYGLIAYQIPYRLIQLARIHAGWRPFSEAWILKFLIATAIILLGQWILRLIYATGIA